MAGRFRRIMPPFALFAGLFLFGISLLVLGAEATEEGTRELHASSVTVANGTALLLYPVERGYDSYHDRIDVEFSFPQAVGDAYFVGCEDVELLARGGAPEKPALAFMRLRTGSFVVSPQTFPEPDILYRYHEPAVPGAGGYREYCTPTIAFQWAAVGGDPSTNLPTVSAIFTERALEGENFILLAILMVGGALITLFGGLAWAKARSRDAAPPPSDDSTVEALRGSLDRMGEQLERTRRHLLFAGVLGIFLWYPFLVPWAWQQAARSSDDPVIPWGVAAFTLVFLVVLTVLWAREFARLDRELNAWRGRLGELRDREQSLLATLDHEGR